MTSIRASQCCNRPDRRALHRGLGRGDAPGFLSITGTVLQNGASLILTFIEKVSHRVTDTSSADPGVHALHDLADVDLQATWSGVCTAYFKAISPEDSNTRLGKVSHVADLRNPFAVLRYYIIVRNEDAKNPCTDPEV